jgi:glycosyltransferase involved in cell wall biosynthesis
MVQVLLSPKNWISKIGKNYNGIIFPGEPGVLGGLRDRNPWMCIDRQNPNSLYLAALLKISKMKPPVLSIIMPVYNSVNYLAEAVESVLLQTFTNFELIIIDDASTDGSAEIISGFKDDRVKKLRNQQNQGIVYSRNRGLDRARGNFVAQFDSDDIAMPKKFEKQINFLKQNPDFGMVGSWVKMIDSEGKLMGQTWKLPAKPKLIPAIMLFRNYFVQSTIVARKEAIPSGGYKTGYDVVEDYKMWIEIARKHMVWNLPEHLVDYRVHGASATNSDNARLDHQYKLIFADLFSELNIELDDDNFKTHLLIKHSGPIQNIEALRQIEEHLKLIVSQNKKMQVYNQKALAKVVSNRWLKCCVRARAAGLKTVATFLTSPLSRKMFA